MAVDFGEYSPLEDCCDVLGRQSLFFQQWQQALLKVQGFLQDQAPLAALWLFIYLSVCLYNLWT